MPTDECAPSPPEVEEVFLSPAEIEFVRRVYTQPGLVCGLNVHNKVVLPDCQAMQDQWGGLSLRVKAAGVQALQTEWKRLVAEYVYCDLYGDWTTAAIAEDLGFDPAQIRRHLENGTIRIETLLLALHQRGSGPTVLPVPPDAFRACRLHAAGMRRWHQFFAQAGVIPAPAPQQLHPWQLWLMFEVMGRAREWESVHKSRGPGIDPTEAVASLACECAGAAEKSLRVALWPPFLSERRKKGVKPGLRPEWVTQIDTLGRLAADRQSAVAECRWLHSEQFRIYTTALAWADGAFGDQLLRLPNECS